MYPEIFISWILQLFAFQFFNLNFFLEDFFLPTTFTHTHTHYPRLTTSTYYPRPTTFSWHFSSFVMYIWTWARKKIAVFWPGNLNKSSWSSGMAERQVRQSYREALVQISPITPTTEKKETGGTGESFGEWEGKKEKERGRKRRKTKKDRNWNPLLSMQ